MYYSAVEKYGRVWYLKITPYFYEFLFARGIIIQSQKFKLSPQIDSYFT